MLVAKRCDSPGQALRDIHSKGLIHGDFVLVPGDLVSNVRVDEILKLHRERREGGEKHAIMTTVWMRTAPQHPTRSYEDSTVLALNATNNQVLHYQNNTGAKDVHLSVEILQHPRVHVHAELMDTRIDVCSPEVLSLFEQNPDYSDLRNDLIKGTLDDEVYNYKIFAHILGGQVCACGD